MFTDAAAIALALQLLGTGPDPRVTVIAAESARLILGDPYTRTCAFVTEGSPKIFVGDWCFALREARQGDARALAAIIAHEQFHKDAHAPEGPAYQRQLDVLAQVKAPRKEVDRVKYIQSRVAPSYRVLRSRPLQVRVMMPHVIEEGGLSARSDAN